MELSARRLNVCVRSDGRIVRSCVVAVYAGISPVELRQVLELRLSTPDIVALVDERDDSVLSLSVVSQSPWILDAPIYRVLVSRKKKRATPKTNETVKTLKDRGEPLTSPTLSFAAERGTESEIESVDDEEERLWLEQARLLMVITYLEDHTELDSNGADILRKLVSDADERAIGAMQLYLEDHDWDELRDTLQRLAQIELNNAKGVTKQEKHQFTMSRSFSEQYARQTKGQDDDDDLNDSEEDEEEQEVDFENDGDESDDELEDEDFEEDLDEEEEEDEANLDTDLTIQVIIALFKRGFLNKGETLILRRLVDMEDPLVLAAAQVYEDRGDEEDFADTLRRIADHVSLEKVLLHLLSNSYISKEEARFLLLEFRTSSSLVTQAWTMYCQHKNQRILADQLLTIIICHDKKTFLARMQTRGVFDEIEVRLLMQMLNVGDPALLGVFDLLLSEGDLADALDSMKRLCLVRGGKFRNARMPSTLDDKSSELLELLEALVASNTVSELQFLLLQGLVVSGDQRVSAAYGTYCANRDIDDLIDTLKTISVLAAPESLQQDAVRFPAASVGEPDILEDQNILDTMFQLVYLGQLQPDDASALSGLLPDRDPRLLAAFDVYQLEGDLEDLADTLIRLANIEQHGGKPSTLESFDEGEEKDSEEEEAGRGDDDLALGTRKGLTAADSFSLDGTNDTITDDDYSLLSSGDEDEENE